MDYSKKDIILIVLLFVIGFGQLGFFALYQTKKLYEFYESGNWDFASQMHYGNFTFDLPPNPLGDNRYCLEQCDHFTYIGSRSQGNTTWTHISSGQTFFFEYYLGTGGYIGDECASVIWMLPLGMYNITWYSTGFRMDYTLYATTIFSPNDLGALIISGVITFWLVFFGIAKIFKWRWK